MSAILQRSKTARGAAYLERGSGETLVLIHGVGMRAEAWAPQIEALSASHRVIAIDMPGHGESAHLASDARLPDFVAWFRDTFAELGFDRVNVAGHSMGALIAGGLAAMAGDQIARVALLNGVYCRTEEARAAVLARASDIRNGAKDVSGPLTRWFGDQADQMPAYHLTHQWLSAVDHAGYATAYAAFANGDATYADCWPKVTCPALFLTGEDDPNSTPDMARAMAALAVDGEAEILQGHRHMVNLTAPDAVNAILEAWLRRPVHDHR